MNEMNMTGGGFRFKFKFHFENLQAKKKFHIHVRHNTQSSICIYILKNNMGVPRTAAEVRGPAASIIGKSIVIVGTR